VNNMMTSPFRSNHAGLVALLLLIVSPIVVQAATEEQAEPVAGGRAMAIEMEAQVTAIDLKTREVTLRGPRGDETTLVAPERVIKLEDVSVGDLLAGTFIAALEGEVRVPTAEELANPWLVMEGSAVSDDMANPSVETARRIRAVVTIEQLNPETGVVVVKDSRGKQHTIGDVEPAKMNGVKVGQQAVMVFTQAMALTLQKQAKPAQ